MTGPRDIVALTKAVHAELVRLTADREQSVVRREVRLGDEIGDGIATNQGFWPGFSGYDDSYDLWLKFLETPDAEIAELGGKALADYVRANEIVRFGLLPLPCGGAVGFNEISERAAIRGVRQYLIACDLDAIRFDLIGGRARRVSV